MDAKIFQQMFARERVMQPNMLLAISLFGVLSLLILPVPSFLLDLLLALSLLLSILILLTTVFIERPLDFNGFPTVLLFATMFRLGLNISSTRLILSDGHEGPSAAGQVIEAFGKFIMQGNFLIGFIIFAILVIINFVVITKGSGRIAEVAARFSLDAMPGKQMAIDADLSAGMIDEATARARRKELEEESSFFGAMDGAAKFVRGDAIAGLLITFVNLLGGLLVGSGQEGMGLSQAGRTYTVLTVGDGLVSQIPALVTSTAAGILVTKAGLHGKTGSLIFKQIGSSSSVMLLSAGILSLLALLPGMPFLPLVGFAGVIGYLAYLRQGDERREQEKAQAPSAPPAAEAPPDQPENAIPLDALRLELGYALLTLIGDGQHIKLPDQIRALRRQLAGELGFVMPSIRIQDNIQLPSHHYVIRVKEAETGRGEVRPGMYLVLNPEGGEVGLPGEDTIEPTFGLPARWVAPDLKDEAVVRGHTAVDAATVMTTHLTEIVKENLSDLLTIAETQKLLATLGDDYQKLVSDVVPSKIPMSGIQRVLQSLLAERISIRDLPLIVESISEAAYHSQNVTTITEHVRSRLGRQICAGNLGTDGQLPVVTLSGRWEDEFQEALVGQGDSVQLAMAPMKIQEFAAAVSECFERLALRGELPVLVTSARARPYVRSLIERFRSTAVVLSHAEIHPKIKLKLLGQV